MHLNVSKLTVLNRLGLLGLLGSWSLVVSGSAPVPPAGRGTPEFQFVRLA